MRQLNSKSKRWIYFERLPRIYPQITDRWAVVTMSGIRIGVIKWYGQWRQYSFFPEPATLFERQCLRAIADFCEQETAKRRKFPKAPHHAF